MQFGAFFLAGAPGREDASSVFKRLVQLTQDAEELGFDSIWIAEHHFSTYGSIPNPLMMATRLAAETSKIRIGTAVLVLPFWHPLRVAEDIALADHLTGGRLEVGVGRGYQPYEFRRFGLTQDDARERTDETLSILLAALRNDVMSYDGKYNEIGETTVLPRPLQQPHPPIWLGANTKESFEIGARLGLRAFTATSGRPLDQAASESWANYLEAKSKHANVPPDFGVQVQICTMPTDDEARAQMPHFRYQNRQVVSLRGGREHVLAGVTEATPYEGEPDLEEIFTTRSLSGSPDTVAASLTRFRDACPMTLLNGTFSAGEMPLDVSRQSMRLFAEEVIPRFR